VRDGTACPWAGPVSPAPGASVSKPVLEAAPLGGRKGGPGSGAGSHRAGCDAGISVGPRGLGLGGGGGGWGSARAGRRGPPIGHIVALTEGGGGGGMCSLTLGGGYRRFGMVGAA